MVLATREVVYWLMMKVDLEVVGMIDIVALVTWEVVHWLMKVDLEVVCMIETVVLVTREVVHLLIMKVKSASNGSCLDDCWGCNSGDNEGSCSLIDNESGSGSCGNCLDDWGCGSGDKTSCSLIDWSGSGQQRKLFINDKSLRWWFWWQGKLFTHG